MKCRCVVSDEDVDFGIDDLCLYEYDKRKAYFNGPTGYEPSFYEWYCSKGHCPYLRYKFDLAKPKFNLESIHFWFYNSNEFHKAYQKLLSHQNIYKKPKRIFKKPLPSNEPLRSHWMISKDPHFFDDWRDNLR